MKSRTCARRPSRPSYNERVDGNDLRDAPFAAGLGHCRNCGQQPGIRRRRSSSSCSTMRLSRLERRCVRIPRSRPWNLPQCRLDNKDREIRVSQCRGARMRGLLLRPLPKIHPLVAVPGCPRRRDLRQVMDCFTAYAAPRHPPKARPPPYGRAQYPARVLACSSGRLLTTTRIE